jgi:hypothetical protein
MRVEINARFATVEDTAKALGVPIKRPRRLVKLADSYRRFKEAGLSTAKALRFAKQESSPNIASVVSTRDSKFRVSSGPLQQKSAKKVSASGKRRTRAKVSKASR